MINTAMKLMKEINGMKFPWNVWVHVLLLVNLIGGLFFITTKEGQFAVVSVIIAFVIMILIYAKKGFVKLLGLGHIAWVPMVVFFALTVMEGNVQGAFKVWLIAILVMNGTSLVIDTVDVVKYVSRRN